MSNLRENLIKEMERRDWNAYDLEQACKRAGVSVSQPTIYRFLSGEHGEPRGVTVRKLAKGLGITEAELRGITPTTPKTAIDSNAEWYGGLDLWDEKTPLTEDEVALPFFKEIEVAAGTGRCCQVIENHGKKLRFARSTLRKKNVQPENAYCVTVSGNSMDPVLPDGTTIGIDTGDVLIKNGSVYAIDHSGELRVKVIYYLPGGGLRLKSFNSDEWPDEHYTQQEAENIRILGRMFWSSTLW